jgi:hypothetical protein
MSKEIRVKHIRAYGHDRYYPICDASRCMCELMRSKCFSKDELKVIQARGYTIVYCTGFDEDSPDIA